MSFLAPLLLLGAVGLAVPIVAHLLGRERPDPLPFAGLRFLRSEEPRVAQRRRIHDLPLLLVRIGLLAAMVLVLARPVTTETSNLRVLVEPHDAVILIDASASMGLIVDHRTQHARALESALEVIDALPPGSRVAVLTSDPAGPRVGWLDDRATVSGELEDWGRDETLWRPGAWLLAEGLADAAAMLREIEGDRPRVVYAIGDPTSRGIGSLSRDEESGILVIPILTRGAPGERVAPPPAHVGITSASWEPAPDIDPRAVRVHATITRQDPATREEARELEVTVALEIAGEEVARTQVAIAPNASASLEFTPTLALAGEGARADAAPDAAAATVVLVDVTDDPLPIDDRRHLWLFADDATSVMVVDGDPSEQRANDEVFFLTTALASTSGRRLAVHGVAPDQLESRLRDQGGSALTEVDVLILANVRAPSAEVAATIRSRVEEGMGWVVTVGDRVVASDYNQRFAALLPLLMRDATFAGTAPGRMDARSESIAPVQLDHPMFAGRASDLDLGATRTRRMMLLEPDPRREAEIAVAFTNGAPAVVTSTLGEGRTVLLTTTIDRAWGDLPLRPGFVALVDRVVTWASGAHEQVGDAQIGVAEERTLRPEAHYRVHTPEDRVVAVSAAREGESPRFADTDRPGHYWAEAGDRERAPRRIDRFVVEIDPRESDTRPIEVAESTQVEQDTALRVQQPRWRELAWLCVLLLMAEAGLRLHRARRLRSGGR